MSDDLTGVMSACKTPFEQAVADRFKQIAPGLKRRTGQYLYDGNRCSPEQQGWRFHQNFAGQLARHRITPEPTPETILAGKHDAELEANWHDAASAEHWYTYEKDWG